MGIFDWLGSVVRCPGCHEKRAKSFLGTVKCANMACPLYDREFAEKNPKLAQMTPEPSRRPEDLRGDFDPGELSVNIEYRNFRGETRTLRGDASTLRRRGRHLSIRLAPTGRRVGLLCERIVNLAEVEKYLTEPHAPSAVERQILGYHQKHGTTSARYEEIRKKFANFSFRNREPGNEGYIQPRNR